MIKTILTTAFISALLIGCNETKHKNKSAETLETTQEIHEHEMEETAVDTHTLNNAWVKHIKLDNGSKWDANVETTEGIDKMLDLVKSHDPKTVEDYHALSGHLNEEKNTVVKKCTMKGSSHDNLHVFLHPLIEKIEILGKVSTIAEGAKISASIKENLEGYYDYFQ